MNTRKRLILTASALALSCCLSAQSPVGLHSHNDYVNLVPFHLAYSQMFDSIECDMFYTKGRFLVGHDLSDLREDATFERLYLGPVLELFRKNGGRAWPESDKILQLMLEVKSKNTPDYLKALVKILRKHPDVFDPSVNPLAVRIVITGSDIPDGDALAELPDYILFDGEYGVDYSQEQLGRIHMISTNLSKLTRWNGKGTLIKGEETAVRKCIDEVHALGKPVRFWGAPDSPTAWYTLLGFGVDFVGTDKVVECAAFFSDWEKKNYAMSSVRRGGFGTVTSTDRLDKTTKSFKGFTNDKLILSGPVETYAPTFLNDGSDGTVKNVILLIGDGMGLPQVSAANRVNGGLTILNMDKIGLVDNSAEDAFTTDSAAAGSALATGEANSNRHISSKTDGTPLPSLTDFFEQRGFACGVVTSGHVADATPAAFYGHDTERDNSDAITLGLLKAKLDLLAGSGMDIVKERKDGVDFAAELAKAGYDLVASVDQIDAGPKPVICLDEALGDAADTLNIGLLARTAVKAIAKLDSINDSTGFFLMVEGAKIDYAGHSKYLPGVIVENLAFDLAVAEALKFADSNGETLVVVTGDHETGGLVLLDGDLATRRLTAWHVTDDHTPSTLPVYAYGPRSGEFTGHYLQREIPRIIKRIINNQ